MGIFSLVPRVIPQVTSQLTLIFKCILCDLQTVVAKLFVKDGLNKNVRDENENVIFH